jgi:hypothetical protein
MRSHGLEICDSIFESVKTRQLKAEYRIRPRFVAQSRCVSWQAPSGLDEAVNVGMHRGKKLYSVITLSVETTADHSNGLSTIHCTTADYLMPCTRSDQLNSNALSAIPARCSLAVHVRVLSAGNTTRSRQKRSMLLFKASLTSPTPNMCRYLNHSCSLCSVHNGQVSMYSCTSNVSLYLRQD